MSLSIVDPEKNTLDWKILNEARNLREQWRLEGSHEWTSKQRVKRQSLSSTDYTVEIYMIVDYYLYVRLAELSATLSWAEGTDDFIAFTMGHLANEVRDYLMTCSSIHQILKLWR